MTDILKHDYRAENCRISPYPATERNQGFDVPLCPVCVRAYSREPIAGKEFPVIGEVPESILVQAEKVINGDRSDDYGPALASFERIAGLWGPIVGVPMTAERVCLALIQLKVARAMHDVDTGRPVKRDTIVDIAGYAGCLEKIVEQRKAQR